MLPADVTSHGTFSASVRSATTREIARRFRLLSSIDWVASGTSVEPGATPDIAMRFAPALKGRSRFNAGDVQSNAGC
jgi:hypothetical protein